MVRSLDETDGFSAEREAIYPRPPWGIKTMKKLDLTINELTDDNQVIMVDGIKWWVTHPTSGPRSITPICPKHNLRMKSVAPRKYLYGRSTIGYPKEGKILDCAEGPHKFPLKRTYEDEKQYVLDRIDSIVFRNMKILNLDDEAVPISKERLTSKNKKYFVTGQLMESKRGLQLVLYAGEKGKSEKTQIFVEPSIKKLSFDQNNLHPSEVFTKIEAIFRDGTKASLIKKP